MLNDYYFGKADGYEEVRTENYDIDTYYYDKGIDLVKDEILILFGRKGNGKTFIAQKAMKDIAQAGGDAYFIRYQMIKRKMQLLNVNIPRLIDWEMAITFLICEELIGCGLIYVEDPEALLPYVAVKQNTLGLKGILNRISGEASLPLGIKMAFRPDEKKSKDSPEVLCEKLITELISIETDKNILFIFDEFDELLFTSEEREALSSFIEMLNSYPREHRIKNVKFVVLLRNDKIVMKGAAQKILLDKSTTLSWTKDDLYEMLDKRLKANGITLEHIFDKNIAIYDYDPISKEKEVNNKSFWDFLMDYTLYRPRDLIEFLNICTSGGFKKLERIGTSDLKKVLKIYSKEYFLNDICDELLAFFQNKDIEKTRRIMLNLFTKLCDVPADRDNNSHYWILLEGFKCSQFYDIAKEELPENFSNDDIIKELFEYLLKIGCIGQLKRIGTAPGIGGKLQWGFTFEGATVNVSSDGRYILHKAIRYLFMEEFIQEGVNKNEK